MVDGPTSRLCWLALKVWIAAIKYSRIYTSLYSRYICVIVSTFLILTFVDSAYLALGIIARGPDFDASLGPQPVSWKMHDPRAEENPNFRLHVFDVLYPIVSLNVSNTVELILTRITTKWSQQTILLLGLCMIKVTTTLFLPLTTALTLVTMKLCNFLRNADTTTGTYHPKLFRVTFYVALGNTHPQTNRILDYWAYSVSNSRVYFCILPTFGYIVWK